MYVARLICSHADCAEEILAEASTLAERETLACECGCGLDVIGWPDDAASETLELGGVDVVVIPLARRSPPADLAA